MRKYLIDRDDVPGEKGDEMGHHVGLQERR